MNPILEQLHDIEGIDPVSWWPLAPGWWGVAAAVLVLTAAIAGYAAARIAFRRSWKYDTLQKLAEMEKRLVDENAGEQLAILAEYLKRIAVKRFSRKECAGLSGEEWLKWLAKRDPKQFDWTVKGRILTDIPYAPASRKLPAAQVAELLQAVKQWVV